MEDDIDELFDAAREGNKSRVKKILEKSNDPIQLLTSQSINGGQVVFHLLAGTVSKKQNLSNFNLYRNVLFTNINREMSNCSIGFGIIRTSKK